MYSWGGNTSDWRGKSNYSYADARKAALEEAAKQSSAKGPRAYHDRQAPELKITTPQKNITTQSQNPLIIVTDVTGSMSTWPAEIFDRLPLLYQTLSQYRPDLEVSFMAVGDANVDTYPLQVTDFARGFKLEERLHGLYGEGGGSGPDPAESYGLIAHYINHHVRIPKTKDRPFLIVFGDVTMQPQVKAEHLRDLLGDKAQQDSSAVRAWQKVTKNWNTWFLSRPGRVDYAEVDKQWAEAIGAQFHIHIHDQARAVDYAMGLVARNWGHFDDFQDNMLARQDESAVEAVTSNLARL